MSHKQCQFCHRFFPSDDPSAVTCDACQSQVDDERKMVRSYLDTHPGASIVEISLATKVPIKSIKRLINIGALNFR